MLVLTKQLSANSFEYVDKIMLQKTELKDLNNSKKFLWTFFKYTRNWSNFLFCFIYLIDFLAASFQLIEDKKRQFTFTCSTPQEKMDWVKELKETLQTLSLHTLVTENLNDTSIKEGTLLQTKISFLSSMNLTSIVFFWGFVVLSATYGPLHKPKNCVDVTQAIRKIVQEQVHIFLLS